MDGTLVNVGNYQESGSKVGVGMWHVVFDSLGRLDEHRRLMEKFKAGGFASYMEWTHEACMDLKTHGLTEKKLLEIINRQEFIKGAKETIEEFKKQGCRTAVITGSFSTLAERVQGAFGIDDITAHCNLEFDEEGKLESWKLLPCDYEGKTDALLQMSKKHGADPSECIYIGNDVNDTYAFQKSGLSIAFNSRKQEVKDAADIVVEGNDLRLIFAAIRAAA